MNMDNVWRYLNAYSANDFVEVQSGIDGLSGRLAPHFRAQIGRRVVCLQVGCVDHHRLRNGSLGGQPVHHRGKGPFVALPPPAIVKCLGRAILPGRLAPAQAMAIDGDYAAQRPPVIDPRLAVALGEEGLQTGHLRIGKPEKVAHDPVSLRRLNHAASG